MRPAVDNVSNSLTQLIHDDPYLVFSPFCFTKAAEISKTEVLCVLAIYNTTVTSTGLFFVERGAVACVLVSAVILASEPAST